MKFNIYNSDSLQGVIDYIKKLNPEKKYNVSITLKRQIRTVPQNRLYWLYLTCIEQETGMDKEDLHIFFKQKYLRKEDLTIGSETIPQTISTTKLTTAQFVDYTNKIVAFASAELGIVLPDPADYMWEQFYEQYKDKI